MPKYYETEKREVFDSKYMKVWLLNSSQSESVRNLISSSVFVRRCNITGEGNLTVYPSRFYSLDEMQKEVERLLDAFYKGAILSKTTLPQCEETKTKISQYDTVKKLYNKAIDGINAGTDYRHALDDLRLAIEIYLKELLQNDKSLENQIGEIGPFLGAHNVSTEIIGNIKESIKAITRYFNQHEKHNDNVKTNEIDYIVCLANSVFSIFSSI